MELGVVAAVTKTLMTAIQLDQWVLAWSAQVLNTLTKGRYIYHMCMVDFEDEDLHKALWSWRDEFALLRT